jgi:translation initiation factor 2 alpha subunit (eIF-2alpha)
MGEGVPRFYFHLYCEFSARDEEGRELADPASAREAAKEDIRSIISDAARRGEIDMRGRVEIADEHGTVVETVSFTDSVNLILAETK